MEIIGFVVSIILCIYVIFAGGSLILLTGFITDNSKYAYVLIGLVIILSGITGLYFSYQHAPFEIVLK
jgi:hypothetical protein